MANILVVDDEHGIRDLLAEILSDEGHGVDMAENAAAARLARARAAYDLVLLDIWMPDTDGVTLLKEWSAAGQLEGTPVIMMSGHASLETAMEATRIGACSFLEKPITLHRLLLAVEQALSLTAPEESPTTEPPPVALSMPATELMIQPPRDDLPPCQQSFSMDRPLREVRSEFERAYFTYHLAHQGSSMTRVAEKTGLERTHLYRKLRQLGMEVGRQRRG